MINTGRACVSARKENKELQGNCIQTNPTHSPALYSNPTGHLCHRLRPPQLVNQRVQRVGRQLERVNLLQQSLPQCA